jgi:hypothetical protein
MLDWNEYRKQPAVGVREVGPPSSGTVKGYTELGTVKVCKEHRPPPRSTETSDRCDRDPDDCFGTDRRCRSSVSRSAVEGRAAVLSLWQVFSGWARGPNDNVRKVLQIRLTDNS